MRTCALLRKSRPLDEGKPMLIEDVHAGVLLGCGAADGQENLGGVESVNLNEEYTRWKVRFAAGTNRNSSGGSGRNGSASAGLEAAATAAASAGGAGSLANLRRE